MGSPGAPAPGAPPPGADVAGRAEVPGTLPADPLGVPATPGTPAPGTELATGFGAGPGDGDAGAGPVSGTVCPGAAVFGMRTFSSRSHCWPATHVPLGILTDVVTVNGETASAPPTAAAAAAPTMANLITVPSRIRPRVHTGSTGCSLCAGGSLCGRSAKFDQEPNPTL